MANFKTHITTSTILGAAYGAAAYVGFGVPLDKCMLAAGLCSVSGMLPDLDSDSSVPVRESFAFAAAIVPMLMIDRFQHMGMSWDSMVLAGGLIYIFIRFGLSEIFKRYTVHRGMWHSIPACAIAGLAAFLICSCSDMSVRLFKSSAVVLGFMSHLVLDEIYSIERKGARARLKKSFGTALKFWGKRPWANFSTYAKLIVLLVIAIGDPIFMSTFERFKEHGANVTRTARDWVDGMIDEDKNLIR
ncbi:MAG: metal-dependent hydrolase [Planctomycetes bacterium]|nr:metal-dependent hydrolase [Planctomycetota bacterium]